MAAEAPSGEQASPTALEATGDNRYSLRMQLVLFRVGILPNDDAGLFTRELPQEEPLRLIRGALLSFRGNGIYRNTRYALYNVEEVDGQAIVGRIGRPGEIERTVLDDSGDRLKDIREPTEEWAHFVFVTDQEQIIAVQKKPEFFSGSEDGLKEILESTIAASLNDPSLQVVVTPITRLGSFWEAIKEAAALFSVELRFVAPNMFRGRNDIADIVNLCKIQHNAIYVNSSIENPAGNLVFERTAETEQEVSFAELGGGSWRIDMVDGTGNRRPVSSGGANAAQISVKDDEESRQSVRHLIADVLAGIRKALR